MTKPSAETGEADQDILFDDVSDEALEAAATPQAAAVSIGGTIMVFNCTCID